MTGEPHAVLARDPALAPLLAAHGHLEVEPAADPFARLVRSIVRQQISMDAAAAIHGRLAEAFTLTPAALAAADPADLRAVGLSSQKAACVTETAATFARRDYDRSTFEGMPTAAVLDEITTIDGIGPWTGKMFCLFGLGREDVFPVEDLGIRAGLRSLLEADVDREAMVARAERWRPYRSYASLYLWREAEG